MQTKPIIIYPYNTKLRINCIKMLNKNLLGEKLVLPI